MNVEKSIAGEGIASVLSLLNSWLTSVPKLVTYLGEQTANIGSTAELRRQIESALAERIPAALSFRPPIAPELLSCGLAEVDAVLGGGLPLGAITELTGAHSSGHTTLALAALAGMTQQGENCAYVDVSDALNPISASALGVDLRRLLWVRAGEPRAAEMCAGKPADGLGSPFPTPAQAPVGEKLGHGAAWCHPRKRSHWPAPRRRRVVPCRASGARGFYAALL